MNYTKDLMTYIKGKYTYARIFAYDIEKETEKQIQSFVDHPVFKKSKIRIMPDCYPGKGAVIGTTATLTNAIIPNVVGSDLNCGILSYNIGYFPDIDFEALDKHIRNEIPLGFKHHDNKQKQLKGLKDPFVSSLIDNFDKPSNIGLIAPFKGYGSSLGTLGGGNHFIELGRDEEEDVWITIHSGSRKFGHNIATYYQNKAKENMKEMFIKEFKNMEFLTKNTGMNDYLNDVKITKEFAYWNRRMMLQKILLFFNEDHFFNEVESVHNYIDEFDGIIRKGAISAQKGEQVVIPFNMEDGLIIGEGLGNPDWNFSAPHGAGRLGSRKWAKANLNLEEAKQSMKDKNIWTSSLNLNNLDEVQKAYKSKDVILDAIKDTVKVLHFVKPIYNLKAN